MGEVRILLLEDSSSDQELITRELKRLGWDVVRWVSSRAKFVEALSEFHPTIVLSDYRLGSFSAREALQLVREKDPDLPFVLITGTLEESAATEFLRQGAADYLLKDRLGRLGPAITRALQLQELREEKAKHEAALRENEARLHLLAEQSRDIIFRFRVKPARAYEYVSPASTEVLGYTPDEHYEDPDLGSKIVHPADRERWVDITHGRLPGGPVLMRWTNKRGQIVYTETHYVPILNERGQVTVIQGVARNVTEREGAYERLRQSERELADRENLLRRIFDAEPECVKLLDEDGRVLEMNTAGIEMIEAESIDQVRHQSIYPFVLPEYRESFKDLVRGVFNGESVNLQFEMVGNKGTRRWMDMHGVPLRDASGRITALLSITRDISKARELEELYRQSQKMEAVGRLAGGVAHDFNNILTIIGGYANLTLALPRIGETVRKNLTSIENAAQRGARLTRQLLAFSRKQFALPRVLDLNALITNTSSLITRVIGEDIHLELQLGSKVGNIKADPGQIEQVLMNLVVNARDAMPQGGTLRLETRNIEFTTPMGLGSFQVQPGRYVKMSVIDSGGGITREDLSHIFEPFFTTKELGKGTGLGLSIVYGVVQQSGGAVTVQSKPSVGTCFEVYFPLVVEPASVQMPIQFSASGGKEKILVVEDDPELRELVRGMLTSLGYEVVTAESGPRALTLLQQGLAVDLILSDVVMPGMSGFVLGRHIEEQGLPVKVMYMSGYTDDFIAQNGTSQLPEGMHLIEKPFTRESLARTLRQVLDAA